MLETRPHDPQQLEERIRLIEQRFRDSAEELKDLREKLLRAPREELAEIKDEWHGVHYKWWVVTLAGVLALFVACFLVYTKLGWVADQRALPAGSDWLLRRLPRADVLPVLSWGWFALHLYAGACAVAYYPKRMPFLLFLLSVFVLVRAAFIFLNPIGAPIGQIDMNRLDWLSSALAGSFTFNSDFVFSGHTAIPFLFFLFFETKWLKALMLSGSIVMAVCMLLSRNHYTVDILAAYFVSYSIYALSEKLYYGWIRPLFQVQPSLSRY